LQLGGDGEFFLIIDSIRFGRSAEPYQSSLWVLAPSSVWLIVLFCFVFPWKMGRKVALSAVLSLFASLRLRGRSTPQSCLLPSVVVVLSIQGCWSRVHLFTSEVVWVLVLNWNFCLRHDLRQPCRGIWRSLGFLSLLSEDFYLLTFLELCLRIGMSYFC
jgi:hypothetical protein